MTLTEREMEKLSIYVQKCKPQTKPFVQNVFVSWSGKNMCSGSISRQLCSVWQKMGISKKGDKNLSSNILRKSASTGIREANDSRTTEVADLMVHHPNTADKYYYIRQKQLSAAAGSTALREKVFKQSAPSMSPVSSKKIWSNSETQMIEELFKDYIGRKEISLEMVREKSNCFPDATPR